MSLTLAQHPARLAAMAAGEKRFRADGFPCKHDHFERYVENLACAICSDLRRPSRHNLDAKPIIGRDVDVDVTNARLIRANAKFLKLLHLEALAEIRNVPDVSL